MCHEGKIASNYSREKKVSGGLALILLQTIHHFQSCCQLWRRATTHTKYAFIRNVIIRNTFWVFKNQETRSMYISEIDVLGVQSGFFLGCKIRGADFRSLQKFFLTMQKFLKPISWTFQKLWISNVLWKNEFWQRWQKFLGCKKIFSPCTNFCMMLQNSLFAA